MGVGEFSRRMKNPTSYLADKWTGAAGAREDREGVERSSGDQYTAAQGVLSGMKDADKAYKDDAFVATQSYRTDRDKNYGEWRGESDALNAEAKKAQSDARTTYTGTIEPQRKSIMEDAQLQAGQAMSLADAGDVNNSVHQGVRGLYNQEGEAQRKMGKQDAGVLANLGAQATATQLGGVGGLMTSGTLASMNAANQSQASEAYARAQQRMASLREQGIAKGFEESDAQYQRGERARDRWAGSVGEYEGSAHRFQDRDAGYRDERGRNRREAFDVRAGRDQDELGIQMGRAGLTHEMATNQGNRELAAQGQKYGVEQANMAAGAASKDARGNAMIGALGGIASGALGGYMGGLAGPAAAGAASAGVGAAAGAAGGAAAAGAGAAGARSYAPQAGGAGVGYDYGAGGGQPRGNMYSPGAYGGGAGPQGGSGHYRGGRGGYYYG